MKKQPLKYRLNVVGGALILFLTLRTYIPYFRMQLGLNRNFNIWLIVYMLTLSFSCLLPIAFIERMCDFHPDVLMKKQFRAEDFALVAAGMGLFIVFSLINSIVLNPLAKAGIIFPPSKLEPINGPFTFFLYFIFTAITPAIFEELFLRGTVLNLLMPYGRKFAILACATVFTMMHTQIQTFIPVFGAGLVLSCIYVYTDNIYVSMALHFVNNTYSFLMMYMQDNINGISFMGFATFMMAVIITSGIFAFLALRKLKINIFTPLAEKGKNAKLTTFFKCPVMVLAIIGCSIAIFSQLYIDLNL